MAAYKQSRSICNKLFEEGEAGSVILEGISVPRRAVVTILALADEIPGAERSCVMDLPAAVVASRLMCMIL